MCPLLNEDGNIVIVYPFCPPLGCSNPRAVTLVKTYVNMHVRKVFKWTHISEVHDQRIAPFSEPLPTGHTLIPQFPKLH